MSGEKWIKVDEGAITDRKKHCNFPSGQIERTIPLTRKQENLLFSYSANASYVPVGIFDSSGRKEKLSSVLTRTIYYRKPAAEKEDLVFTDSHQKTSIGSLYWFKDTSYHGIGHYRIVFEMEEVQPLERCFEVIANSKEEHENLGIYVEDGGLILRRPCEEKVIAGPYLNVTIPGKFRLFLLDDLELGSSADPFGECKAEEIFLKIFNFFSHARSTSSSSSLSSSSSPLPPTSPSSLPAETAVESSCSSSSGGGIDTAYETTLIKFQSHFEHCFISSVLYTDERKIWKQIIRSGKKKSISQLCSPMFLLRYIIFLVGRIGTGQVTSIDGIKGELDLEEQKVERGSRKRSRESAYDNSECVNKLQNIIDRCMVEMGHLLDKQLAFVDTSSSKSD